MCRRQLIQQVRLRDRVYQQNTLALPGGGPALGCLNAFGSLGVIVAAADQGELYGLTVGCVQVAIKLAE